MPRDYKHRATRRRKRSPASPWFGLLAGLLIGLFIAFLVYIKMLAPPGATQQASRPVEVPESAPPPTAAELGKPAQASLPPPPKPRFDFYTILPEMEIVVPEQEITGKPEQGIRQVELPGTYFLQVGSFSSANQADRFKAELALLGLQTSIQKVTINNQDTYHRVRVGPYRDLDELNKVRRLLKKQGVEGALIRVTG
jgi:cell division protein FtsN